MKTRISAILLSAALAASTLAIAGNAAAQEQARVLGPVTRITMAADGRSAKAVLKDAKSGEEVTLTITDDLTLDKFKEKKIVEGDEIRARYLKDSSHTSQSFRKTAGC